MKKNYRQSTNVEKGIPVTYEEKTRNMAPTDAPKVTFNPQPFKEDALTDAAGLNKMDGAAERDYEKTQWQQRTRKGNLKSSWGKVQNPGDLPFFKHTEKDK